MSAPSADLQLYRKLLLTRLAEESIREDYFNDEMKTPVHLGIGAEAISVGVTSCLREDAKYFGTYRNHNLYLSLSEDTDGFFGELFGRETGIAKGKAGSMHLSCPDQGLVLTSAVVATTIPVAVGTAFAQAYQGKQGQVAVFFGDGAIEEGVFWESLNFAKLRNLPVLFVCEDNDLAIHTQKNARQGFKSFSEIMSGFGCHYETGEGTDLRSVIAKTKSILAKMQKDPGPGFLHFPYFRFLQHVGPLEDFDAGYRSPPEDGSAKFDPVVIFEKDLIATGISEAQLRNVRTEVQKQINESMAKARAAGFAAQDELLRDVYVQEFTQ